MLDFLKKWFAKKPEALAEEVALADLLSWFDEKTKPSIESLNAELKEAGQRVSSEIGQARQNVKVLNSAELLNPNIPERAKHFMAGNRDAYSKKINSFLDQVQLPDDISGFSVFHSAMQEKFKELTQGTARPFQILQEFFANESRQVLANIGSISKELDSFKQKLDSAGLNLLGETKKGIIDFQARLNLRNALEQDLRARQKELEELTAGIKKLKEDVELLQKDRGLSELKSLLKDADYKAAQVQEKVLEPFSAINPALRKFEHITYRHRMIVKGYAESPIEALMQDLHLGIIKALHDMELAIMNNRIDLKDKKREKTLEVMKLLTKEYLGSFLTEYGQAKRGQDKLKKQIAELDVVVLLKEKKEKVQKLENTRIDVERKIDLFSKELAKVDIAELENKLIENLRKITNIKVAIKL